MDYGPLGTSLSQGSLDVGAAALCATDERKKNMNFTQTYYDAGIVVGLRGRGQRHDHQRG